MFSANVMLVLVLTLLVVGGVGSAAAFHPLRLLEQWSEHRHRQQRRALELALLEEQRLNEQLRVK